MPKLTPIRGISGIVGIVLALAASATMAGDWQLPELMQLLSQHKASKASFTEKKFIGIIDNPIVSSGELTFTAPDKLEKHTVRPKPESLILEGDSLTIDQPGKRRLTVSLQEHPEVAAFVESIRGTLAGDRFALESFYKLELTGSIDKWQLELVPTQTRMRNIISRIRIGGTNANVKSIGFEQADGDRTEMSITRIIAQ